MITNERAMTANQKIYKIVLFSPKLQEAASYLNALRPSQKLDLNVASESLGFSHYQYLDAKGNKYLFTCVSGDSLEENKNPGNLIQTYLHGATSFILINPYGINEDILSLIHIVCAQLNLRETNISYLSSDEVLNIAKLSQKMTEEVSFEIKAF